MLKILKVVSFALILLFIISLMVELSSMDKDIWMIERLFEEGKLDSNKLENLLGSILLARHKLMNLALIASSFWVIVASVNISQRLFSPKK
ncbi:hypothetical protein [Reichenbachiella sp.]|uniref:hypothetical protein n=1 Tax=Reichenbachiella sp. TaxID=2184521 RepID=UPI00329773A4